MRFCCCPAIPYIALRLDWIAFRLPIIRVPPTDGNWFLSKALLAALFDLLMMLMAPLMTLVWLLNATVTRHPMVCLRMTDTPKMQVRWLHFIH